MLVDIHRLDEIHAKMEELNREARNIITGAVGYSASITNKSRHWTNAIEFALNSDNAFQNTCMHDTINELKELIDCGELGEVIS